MRARRYKDADVEENLGLKRTENNLFAFQAAVNKKECRSVSQYSGRGLSGGYRLKTFLISGYSSNFVIFAFG
jgi:hypothetical protein